MNIIVCVKQVQDPEIPPAKFKIDPATKKVIPPPGVPPVISVFDERAVEAMQKGYSQLELTPARLRMARIPHGAELVDNPVSRAPGFMLGNVIVMAGIPRIMQVMLNAVAPRLKKGRPMLSRSIRIEAPEGDVAPGLAAIQAAHEDVQIGSYPFFEKSKLGTYVVLRSVDTTALDRVHGALRELIAKERFKASEGEAEGKS